MKRILACFLAIVLALGLVACGNTSPQTSSDFLSSVESILSADNVSVNSEGEDQNSKDSNCSLAVNGIALAKYKIIYDEDDTYSKYAADNFAVYLKQKFDVVVETSGDSAKQDTYEILIGDTNRNLDVANVAALSGKKYALKAVGTKIVLKANGYMIGGAVRGFLDICESTPKTNDVYNVTISEDTVTKTYEYKEAKNALLYIGDGMGFNHIKWAMSSGMPKFYAEDMPNKGEAITYSHSVTLGNAKYTDSAAAGTALATGYKTLNGYVGVDISENSLANIRELASSKGAKTAVLTTDAITGATPAAFLAHVSNRDSTGIIQREIDSLRHSDRGLRAYGNLDYNLVPRSITALKEISSGDKGFFMMLEEGYIDKNSHNKDEEKMIQTVVRFNEAIANAMELTLVRGDTVLIVTADHETGGVTQNTNGFEFTSGNHTNVNVPLFAMGKGTEIFNGKSTDNVLIPRFIAKIYGEQSFGDMSINF